MSKQGFSSFQFRSTRFTRCARCPIAQFTIFFRSVFGPFSALIPHHLADEDASSSRLAHYYWTAVEGDLATGQPPKRSTNNYVQRNRGRTDAVLQLSSSTNKNRSNGTNELLTDKYNFKKGT